MEKKLVQSKNFVNLETLKRLGNKALIICKKVVDHPLTKTCVYIAGGLLIGNAVMKNGYDATADLGFASFSLTKRA